MGVGNGVGPVRTEAIAVFARRDDMGGKLDHSERRHHADRPPIERRKQEQRHQCVSCSLHDPASSPYQMHLRAATDGHSWLQQKRIVPGPFAAVEATYDAGGNRTRDMKLWPG